MTNNADQKRNKDAGIPGNGGKFAPDSKPDGAASLVVAVASRVDALQAQAGEHDLIRERAVAQSHRTNAMLVDALIAKQFPDAVTARFNRGYQEEYFELEELCDEEGDVIFHQHDDDDVSEINRIASYLGDSGEDYLGEEAESMMGTATEFKVGTIGAGDAPTLAVINLAKPDLSALTLDQKNALQTELVFELGIVVPITDVNEASYRLFEELEDPETAEQSELAGRINKLGEKHGSREAVARAVTETQSWGSLEEYVVEALTDKNAGTRAMVHQAVTELEGK